MMLGEAKASGLHATSDCCRCAFGGEEARRAILLVNMLMALNEIRLQRLIFVRRDDYRLEGHFRTQFLFD